MNLLKLFLAKSGTLVQDVEGSHWYKRPDGVWHPTARAWWSPVTLSTYQLWASYRPLRRVQ